MDLLGQQRSSVISLSSAFASDWEFVSLGGDGSLVLWDTRLKKRIYQCLRNSTTAGIIETGEVLFVPDQHLVLALWDNHVQCFDTRGEASDSLVASYKHDCEVVRFLYGAHPPDRRSTLVVDEEGVIIPFDLPTMGRAAILDEFVFGIPVALPDAGLGALSNYSAGLGLVETTCGPGTDPRRLLFSLGMDGKGCLLSGPAPAQRHEFQLGDLALTTDGCGQLFNPPISTCCGFGQGGRLVVGRADGTYVVGTITPDAEVQELLVAPGHATNGLCLVEFAPREEAVLTVSLCGQITVWDVEAFLRHDDVVEEELPAVRCALEHREGAKIADAVVNCANLLGRERLLTGDAYGCVVSSNLGIN